MEIIKYEIEVGDTLQSIAEKFNVKVNDLITFHNSLCGITQQIIDHHFPVHLSHLFLDKKWSIPSIASIDEVDRHEFKQDFKYRTEFVVATKLESILVDNSTYKSQYHVKLDDERKNIAVIMEENHVSSSPALVQKGMQLIADIDKIKCNSMFQVSPENGKIIRVLNYDEIISNWKKFKSNFNRQKTVMNFSKSQQDIDNFITTVESLIIPEQRLIKDYDTKMFYEVFFNSFLVGKGDFSEGYSKTFYSTLFDQEPVVLNFTSTIIEENEDIIKVRRVSEMDPAAINLKKIIRLYDERIKPAVHYSFSEYKYSIRETLSWNKNENIWQDTHITVIEEVKNNVQLLIDFNLKLIE
ncbi:LysM peptidoglycan-binding domain-containing protein [Chryseobacterium sp. CT-SW4]|uniref:LysM peptidoglycan-binding domain-containing protein n=1 Tax=Chryseobacterium sp. SW-1 TaxID=3157343 RepID=UPI003B025893